MGRVGSGRFATAGIGQLSLKKKKKKKKKTWPSPFYRHLGVRARSTADGGVFARRGCVSGGGSARQTERWVRTFGRRDQEHPVLGDVGVLEVVDGAGVAVAHQRRVGGGLHGHRATGAGGVRVQDQKKTTGVPSRSGSERLAKEAGRAPARGRVRFIAGRVRPERTSCERASRDARARVTQSDLVSRFFPALITSQRGTPADRRVRSRRDAFFFLRTRERFL